MADRYQDGDYLEKNPNWHVEDSPQKAQWIDTLLSRCNINPSQIVEVGCGAGEILLELQKLRPEVEYRGYEISAQAFALCSQKARPGVTFYHEDVTKGVSEPFNLTMLIDVFEHVPDYMGFIESFRNVSDYMVFHIPLDLSSQGIARGHIYSDIRKSIGHLHYFTKDTALDTLKDCGLEVIGWNYTRSSQDLPNKALITRLTNIPRRLIQSINEDAAARLLGGYSMMAVARWTHQVQS